MTTRKNSSLVALLAVTVGALTACSDGGESDDPAPIDKAKQQLGEYVSDTTRIAGYRITPTVIEVTAGEPPSRETIFVSGENAPVRQPVGDPAQPRTVPGKEFPLVESIELAERLVEGCDGDSTVDVHVVSPGVVGTQATCDGVASSAYLAGTELKPVADATSATGIAQLWSEIETAGLGSLLTRISIDVTDDEGSAQMIVTVLDSPYNRAYQWHRGLRQPSSSVNSPRTKPAKESFNLSDVPADKVGALMEEISRGLPPSDAIGYLTLEPGKGQVMLVVQDTEGRELAALSVNESN